MNFSTDVIQKSHTKPVVVDFWADWCGPCKMLGPVIEQLAKEQQDKWELVKVDTEANQAVARQFGIRSIPNVKMFHKGQVVAEFSGALPRHAIEKWLSENLPDETLDALSGILEKDGHFPNPAMVTLLEHFLEQNPDSGAAKIALARHLVFYDKEKAGILLSDFRPSDKEYESVEDIQTIAELLQFEHEPNNPVSHALERARQHFLSSESEEGIKEIIKAATLDKSFLNDLPRRAAIAFFRLWGSANPLTKKYRRMFDMVLY